MPCWLPPAEFALGTCMLCVPHCQSSTVCTGCGSPQHGICWGTKAWAMGWCVHLPALCAACVCVSLLQVRTFSRDELRSLFKVNPNIPCETHCAIKCTCDGSLEAMGSCRERATAAGGGDDAAEQQGILAWAHLAKALDSPDPTWGTMSSFARDNFVTYVFSDHVLGEQSSAGPGRGPGAAAAAAGQGGSSGRAAAAGGKRRAPDSGGGSSGSEADQSSDEEAEDASTDDEGQGGSGSRGKPSKLPLQQRQQPPARGQFGKPAASRPAAGGASYPAAAGAAAAAGAGAVASLPAHAGLPPKPRPSTAAAAAGPARAEKAAPAAARRRAASAVQAKAAPAAGGDATGNSTAAAGNSTGPAGRRRKSAPAATQRSKPSSKKAAAAQQSKHKASPEAAAAPEPAPHPLSAAAAPRWTSDDLQGPTSAGADASPGAAAANAVAARGDAASPLPDALHPGQLESLVAELCPQMSDPLDDTPMGFGCGDSSDGDFM